MGRGGAAEGDRQLLLAEMKRLREQYEDLIKQMEQTQAIIDKQQVSHRGWGGWGGGAAEGDRQLLLAEMKRLREQYEDLIKQMEQTQAIIDKQQVSHRGWGGWGGGGCRGRPAATTG